jgi:8-amino-7-oxononanoate synthase
METAAATVVNPVVNPAMNAVVSAFQSPELDKIGAMRANPPAPAGHGRGNRNTRTVVDYSLPLVEAAVAEGVMHLGYRRRDGKRVELAPGKWAAEFLNCSYLGLDMRPEVIESYRNIPRDWGVGFCCARTRLSLEKNFDLEAALSRLFDARAVVFPSVTSTHMSVMPLLASGALIGAKSGVRLIFDKLAHSSMQYLRPILEKEAEVVIIEHNRMDRLKAEVEDAESRGLTPVYVSDGIYSMGGACPIEEVRRLLQETSMWWYVDDAHGTSLYGSRGQGFVIASCGGVLPPKTILQFSLAKAFGATGGGVLVRGEKEERLIRYFGQTYAFSAPMDYGAISASMTLVRLHENGTVARLQKKLAERIADFDRAFGVSQSGLPIRMVMIGDERTAIRIARTLLDEGYLVNCAFFPTVGRGKAQLRISLSAANTKAQVLGLAGALKRLGIRATEAGGLALVEGHA